MSTTLEKPKNSVTDYIRMFHLPAWVIAVLYSVVAVLTIVAGSLVRGRLGDLPARFQNNPSDTTILELAANAIGNGQVRGLSHLLYVIFFDATRICGVGLIVLFAVFLFAEWRSRTRSPDKNSAQILRVAIPLGVLVVLQVLLQAQVDVMPLISDVLE